MNIIKANDYNDMSRKAANIISAQVIVKPDCVLGLATGSSPLGLYANLVERYKQGDLDFSQVKSVNLDEYLGLTHDNPQSYYYFMNENLFRQINIAPENTHIPDGLAENAEQACAEYEQIIQSLGGIDLQLLGLGNNGHIGFNEPGTAFEQPTHCVSLTESTIQANSRFFEKLEDVPTKACTMGIKSIMSAKKIVIIVNGKGKADIVQKAFFGPVTTDVPASILQMHPNVTLVADAEALSLCDI
ncbi:MAG: glucosamine-6-phosphate deaminase [Lachnospiraceae bacterium]|jgi:glucosamine-6-phosphate isomerase|nr:glucosamine-6-phosphate deaminase [Lachnospiraceae bacterium]